MIDKCPVFEAHTAHGRHNIMADVSMLQGYLLKEKSKMTLLHGLTGDINKRYFRVRTIEGGEELALCYYKNITDPEVRGWIYLKDMTEIAEMQDTIILTSVARTLYLYAQTRAEHNVWVTGLAKLCPEAFVKLGRNAPTQKEMSDGPSTISSRISPPKPQAGETSSARNHHRSLDEDIESNGLIVPQVTPALVDDKTNVSNEDCTRPTFKPIHGHKRGKPTVRGNGSSKGGTTCPREPGRPSASRSTPRCDPHRALGRNGRCSDNGAARAGDVFHKRDHHQSRRPSGDGETCSQSSSNDFVKDVEGHETARARDNIKSQDGRRRDTETRTAKKDDGIDGQGSDAETEVNRTTDRKGTGGTDFERNERSMGEQDIRLNFQRSHEDSSEDNDDNGNSNGGDRECGQVSSSREVERVEPRGTQPKGGAATSGETVNQCGTDDGKKSFRSGHGCATSTPLKACSSDNENVETIELGESVDRNYGAGGIRDRNGTFGHVQQGINGLALENELKGSNQDEESELDEEEESDVFVPPLELLDWEGPRQGQSATSRLHRHISGNDPDALGSANATLPPPKEFLASRPLQSPARIQGKNEDKNRPDGQRLEPESLRLENGLKSARKGRRTSAADLVWGEGEELRDQPRRLEDKISSSTNYGPVNLGDSDDDEEEDFYLEIGKQRRRASAAVLALETAAKEADEDAQTDRQKGSDCKRPCENAKNNIAKVHRERCVPSPAGPPPAGALRKGRRGQGVPPPRVAPPKLESPTRAKLASHRTDSEGISDNSNWDDEIKTPCHGSPTMGSRGPGGLPAAVGASEAATAPGVASGVDQGQANDWEHFDD